MDVLRSIINKKRGLRIIEDNINKCIRYNFKHLIHEFYIEVELQLAFNKFKAEVCTIRAFNYYVKSTSMYTNDFGTHIVVNIRHDYLQKEYKMSMYIRR